MSLYAEVSISQTRPKHLGNVLEIEKLNPLIKLKGEENSMYRSTYLFGKAGKSYVEKRNSLSGYRGNLILPRLIWDVDSEQAAQEDAIIVIDELVKRGVPRKHILIEFSGMKGFHISVPVGYFTSPKSRTTWPTEIPPILKEIYPEADTSFYVRAGFIRLTLTLHQKSGLYKVPISHKMLNDESYSDIQGWAKEPVYERVEGYENTPMNYVPSTVLESPAPTQPLKPKLESVKSKDHSQVYLCGNAMFNEGAQKGKRNHVLLRLIRILRDRDLNQSEAYILVRDWNERSEDPLPGKDLTRHIANAYDSRHAPYRCTDEIMAQYCDPRCSIFTDSQKEPEVRSAMDLIDLLRMKYRNPPVLNLNQIWEGASFALQRGTVVVMTGQAKTGKSALMANVFVNVPHLRILNCHFEMSEQIEIERMMQIRFKLKVQIQHDINEVHDYLDSTDPEKVREDLKQLSHISFYSGDRTLPAIRKQIEEVQPDIVLVDSLEMITKSDRNKNEFAAEGDVVRGLIAIAKQENVLLILVNHLKKTNASMPSMQDLKGSSTIYQQTHASICLSKTPAESYCLYSMTSRDAQSLNVALYGNRETLEFTANHPAFDS